MNLIVPASYNTTFIVLSYLISCVGSFVALTAGHKIVRPNGAISVINCLSAGLALGGIGVWSMHFIGMLALKVDLAVGYALLETVVSLVAAVAATSLAFYFVARGNTLARIVGAGAVLGLGVCVMHYLGMYGMRFGGYIQWSFDIVGISVLIAIAAATAALWLSFNTSTLVLRVGAAAVMGVAVCAMHYTGMAAADFICTTPNRMALPRSWDVISSFQLPLLVSMGALGIAFVISVDQFFQRVTTAHQRKRATAAAPLRPQRR